MRVPVRSPLSSARPDRGVLLATLFGLLTIGLVVAFGAVDPTEPLIDAGVASSDGESASGELAPRPQLIERATESGAEVGADGSTSSPDEQAVFSNYQDPIAELESQALAGPETLVLSSPPPQPAPATPTTVETTTTAAPTTTTTAADTTASTDPDSGSDTTAQGGEDTVTTVADETSSTTDTTAASSTTEAPTTTAAPGAWVDTGNGVLVPPVLLAIRFCESTDNYLAANPYSSARGAYQFLTSSWASYGHAERYGVNQAHLATPSQQDEAALITWQQSGTSPWNASRSCWS